jgi:hypothetical protein
MLEDFKRVLARVQSDYDFYVECQTDSAAAFRGYDLSPDERSTLSDPRKLADVLEGGIKVDRFRFSFIITITGSHDWINRAIMGDPVVDDMKVATEVDAIKHAASASERSQAVLRLIDQIG